MSRLSLFATLVGLHALADYPLQGSFLATAKNRTQPVPGVPWYQALAALAAHAAIHGLMVGVATRSVKLGVLETLIHSVTDDAKCRNKLTYNQDQAIHVFCKALWAMTTTSAFPLDR